MNIQYISLAIIIFFLYIALIPKKYESFFSADSFQMYCNEITDKKKCKKESTCSWVFGGCTSFL
jgi:hypothetical protein